MYCAVNVKQIDNGTFEIRSGITLKGIFNPVHSQSGWAGDDAPRSVFPNVSGNPKYVKPNMGGHYSDATFVGDNTNSKRGILKLKYPMEHGVVVDWNDMELCWHHIWSCK